MITTNPFIIIESPENDSEKHQVFSHCDHYIANQI